MFHDRLFTDFYISFCSRISGNKSGFFSTSPTCYTLCFVLSGKGVVTSGTASRLERGYWLLIPPGASIQCRPAAHQSWELLRIGFTGRRMGQILSLMGLDDFNTPFLCTDPDHVGLLAKELLSVPDDPSLKQILLRQSVACRILAALAEKQALWPEGRHPALNTYVTDATEYISHHYKEPLTVSQIASHLGITRNYLFTLFKGELHCSPREYILTFRMKRACELLRHTEYSVEDIALSCGYGDPDVFSRAFRKCYGQTPNRFRKNLPTASLPSSDKTRSPHAL